jgi:protein-disulfide isomerase
MHSERLDLKRRVRSTIGMCCFGLSTLFGLSPCALGQQADSSQDMKTVLSQLQSLKTNIEAMRNDIQQIKAGLSQQPSPTPLAVEVATNIVLDIKGRMFRGQEGAKVTMVEFSDYQCPFCRNFESNTFPRIEREYIDAGKLKYYSLNFPLKGHQNAEIAARAALCANDQGKFWEMHDSLFSGHSLTRDSLIKMSQELRMDDAGFQECLDMGGYTDEVQRDFTDGVKAGVHGIPCFFLGFTNPKDNKMQVLRLVSGARPFDQFKEVLDELLSSHTP